MRSFGPSSNIVIEGQDTSALPAGTQPPNPENFEEQVFRRLTQLDDSETGHIILSAVAARRERRVTIIPGVTIAACGARALGAGAGPGGEGSDVGIAYSAATTGSLGELVELGEQVGTQPDAVLLHELVHALHMMRGGSTPQRMGDGFDNREEFYAIVIANLYCSALGRALRLNHHGFSVLNPFDSVVPYHLRYFRELSYLSEEGVGLGLVMLQRLSRVQAPFNPVRDYVATNARLDGVSTSEWRRSPYLCRAAPPRPLVVPSPLPRVPGRLAVGF